MNRSGQFLVGILLYGVACSSGKMGKESWADLGPYTDVPFDDSVTGTPDSGASPGYPQVRIDGNTPGHQIRDLFGLNNPPLVQDAIHAGGDWIDMSPLYQSFGSTAIRLHDMAPDNCDIFLSVVKTYKGPGGSDTPINGCSYAKLADSLKGVPHVWWNVTGDVDDPDNYDFTAFDRVILNALAAHLGIYLRLGMSFNGPNDTLYPEKWAAVSIRVYRHLIGDFKPTPGIAVDPVAVEVHNEPDGGAWAGSREDFYTIFRETVDGVRAAAAAKGRTVRIGGPGFTNEYPKFWNQKDNVAFKFVQNVTSGRLDFLSAHRYDGCAKASLSATADWLDAVRAKMGEDGLTSTPLDITEHNIGLGQACGDLFSSMRPVSYLGGLLTLFQEPEWNVGQAHFYAGSLIGMALFQAEDGAEHLVVEPMAWAFFAHSRLRGMTRLATEVCETAAHCASGRDLASESLLAIAASDGQKRRYYVVVTNESEKQKDYVLRFEGLKPGAYTVGITSFPTSPVFVTTTRVGDTRIPTPKAMQDLEAQAVVSSRTVTVTADGRATIADEIPGWSIRSIDARLSE